MKSTENKKFASYFDRYVSLVDDLDKDLTYQDKFITTLLTDLEIDLDYRYAEGKWSVKEMVIHILDSETIFTCRALRIARGDDSDQPGYDHEAYAQNDFSHLDRQDLLSIFKSQRSTSKHIFSSFNEEQKSREGSAAGNILTPGILPRLIAGHCKHHINILKERYGISID